MIAYISGKVVSIEQNIIVVECGGIGYEIIVSTTTAAAINRSETIRIHTYMQVREDAMTLYGFNSLEEKGMFLKLISVTGIGCKVAISILSGISPVDLAVSIASGDTAMLSTIKGIGKKTAGRIILELKEKVSPIAVADTIGIASAAVAGGSPGAEALEALSALGLSRAECAKSVSAAVESGMATTEAIIGYVLKNLGN